MKIEYLNKEELKPYANNAKVHTAEQIEQIKSSIEQFGFNDPIAVWHDNEIIEGHGRLLAVMEMDEIDTVPVIRLDNLTDEQKRAYTLVHNKLTMNTDFDFSILTEELENIEMDMLEFGFLEADVTSFFEDEQVREDYDYEEEESFEIICSCESYEQKMVVIDFLKENNIDYKE